MNIKSAISTGIRRFVAFLTSLSYVRLGFLYGSMILGFGLIYFALFVVAPHHAPNLGGGGIVLHLLNGIYFSIITAASVGYGDISPHGFSKVIASFESLSSLFTFAILVSKPISERQETALYQMHKLALDEIFTSVREGLYIIRKDFDAIIEEVRATKALSEHGRDNLETALHQAQVLMEDIQNFFDTEREMYVLDGRREILLAEAVKRTLERLQFTLSALKAAGVATEESTRTVLTESLSVITAILGLWSMHASDAIRPTMEEAMTICRAMSKQR